MLGHSFDYSAHNIDNMWQLINKHLQKPVNNKGKKGGFFRSKVKQTKMQIQHASLVFSPSSSQLQNLSCLLDNEENAQARLKPAAFILQHIACNFETVYILDYIQE